MAAVNKTRFAILGLLTLGPMSGYDLKKMIEGSLIFFWRESYGQIYPMLKKLVAEGLAERRGERTAGKPDRIVHSITEQGRRALLDWLNEPVEFQTERNEPLLRLFFGVNVEPAVQIAQLREIEAASRGQLEVFAGMARRLRANARGNSDLPYWLMALSYGRHINKARLDWCRETLSILESLGGARKAPRRHTPASGRARRGGGNRK